MAFNKEDKVAIKVLRQEKGYGAKKFLNESLNKNLSPLSLKKLLAKLDQTGAVDRNPGSDKKHETRIAQKLRRFS